MAGFARWSRANAVLFFVSPGGVPGDAGKNNRGCPGEMGRAAGFALLPVRRRQGAETKCSRLQRENQMLEVGGDGNRADLRPGRRRSLGRGDPLAMWPWWPAWRNCAGVSWLPANRVGPERRRRRAGKAENRENR